MTVASQSLLFAPAKFRKVTLRNHIMLSPMCTYSANEGMASDWHVVHLGQFAIGGFGAVFLEATAVTEQGRITYGDIGLWSNAHIPPLARIANALASTRHDSRNSIGSCRAKSQQPAAVARHGGSYQRRCTNAQRAPVANGRSRVRSDGYRLACSPRSVG